MCHGYPSHVIPLHNVDALAHSKYFIVGKMMATAIVQSGQPPVYFANAVADYIVYDSMRCSVDLEGFTLQGIWNFLSSWNITKNTCRVILKVFFVLPKKINKSQMCNIFV